MSKRVRIRETYFDNDDFKLLKNGTIFKLVSKSDKSYHIRINPEWNDEYHVLKSKSFKFKTNDLSEINNELLKLNVNIEDTGAYLTIDYIRLIYPLYNVDVCVLDLDEFYTFRSDETNQSKFYESLIFKFDNNQIKNEFLINYVSNLKIKQSYHTKIPCSDAKELYIEDESFRAILRYNYENQQEYETE